jgi:glycosyltransferase involved in cell wall biosynthesis
MKFLVYGKEVHKSYRLHLNSLKKNNKWEFVEFMGRTDNVPVALSAGDVFISPSQTEGFGISVLEAAAASKPIVATKVGAIPEMVIDGVNGYFVDWAKPDQIFNACKKILDNREVEFMGKESARIAKRSFSIDKVVEQHIDLYNSLSGRS